MPLTTVKDTKAGIVATNGKIYFAKRHDRHGPWQIFTTVERAMAWLEARPVAGVLRWN